MKFKFIILLVFSLFLPLNISLAQSTGNDFPLLSQGGLTPPPPPPGYAPAVPSMEPTNPPVPQVPVLPQGKGLIPPSAQFTQNFKPGMTKSIQGISPSLANSIKRFGRSIYTFRSIIDKPEDAAKLRRIQNIGRICSELLGLARFPVPARFVSSSRDRVLRDRSYHAVEYRYYGDFNNRVNGWIKPINTTLYADLTYDGKGRRRTHVKAQLTRIGVMTGTFYAYTWDKYGRPWKIQGTLNNVLCRDNGLPSSGDIEIFGADVTGKTMKLSLHFPVKVIGEKVPEKKETRHREGQSVHIGR